MRIRKIMTFIFLFFMFSCHQEKQTITTVAQEAASQTQQEINEVKKPDNQGPQETAAQRYAREKDEARLTLSKKDWILKYAEPSDKDYAEKVAQLLEEPIAAVKQARFVGQTDITLLEGMYVQYKQDGQYHLDNPGVFMLIDYDTNKAQYTMELVFPDSETNKNLYLYGKGAFDEATSSVQFAFDGDLSGKQIRVKFTFGSAKRNQNTAPVRIIEYCTLESADFAYELFSGTIKLIMLF